MQYLPLLKDLLNVDVANGTSQFWDIYFQNDPVSSSDRVEQIYAVRLLCKISPEIDWAVFYLLKNGFETGPPPLFKEISEG